jgi:transcriptional regulator with XRE-family HTH domain
MARRDLAEAFATEMRLMRTTMGLSQEELADRAGLHRNYVGMIERLQRIPTLRALDGLARGLHIRPSDLIAKAERRAGTQK